jgi:hypothetical protein
MFFQQFVHFAEERNVPAACPLEIRRACFRRDHLQGFKENFPFRHDAKGFNHEWTTMNMNCWGQSESSHWWRRPSFSDLCPFEFIRGFDPGLVRPPIQTGEFPVENTPQNLRIFSGWPRQREVRSVRFNQAQWEQLIGGFGIVRSNGAEYLGGDGHAAIMRRRSQKASAGVNVSFQRVGFQRQTDSPSHQCLDSQFVTSSVDDGLRLDDAVEAGA